MDSCSFPGAIRLSSLIAGAQAACAAAEERMSAAATPAQSSFEHMSYLHESTNDRCSSLTSPSAPLIVCRFLNAYLSRFCEHDSAHHGKSDARDSVNSF